MNRQSTPQSLNRVSYLKPRELRKIALLGNYPPRQCGIATFTSDLANALAVSSPGANIDVIAMSDGKIDYSSTDVWHTILVDEKTGYQTAADFLNYNGYDVLSVQHEFGIFGGRDGNYLLTLLRRVNMPIITTLHTVLQNPSDTQKAVMLELIQLSERVVVMSDIGRQLLLDVYKALPENIDLIPHGIPDFTVASQTFVKDIHRIKGSMILTFGLLSPDKGIEYVIKAMPQILVSDPGAVYVVLGATHPQVKARTGEQYRDSLVSLAAELGVLDRVIFVDQFVSQAELVEYLLAADVYITPYLNPLQITSGTLAYALGAGKTVISTPYLYAQELLAEGRGILVKFRDEKEIATAFSRLFSSQDIARKMKSMGAKYCRPMQWSAVGSQYLQSLATAQNDHAARLESSKNRILKKPVCSSEGNRHCQEQCGAEIASHLLPERVRLL